MQPALPQPQSQTPELISRLRFSGLRGVRWRIDLGILPSFRASIDDLRRVAADSRRRYANLRRRLIIDPHASKDEHQRSDLVMDNPLSQNPDSIWGRFFRNAELGRLLDQDLSRLYPEEGSYLQTATCQSMLRHILLLWCLVHPECGYRQGMHELLAPLLFVLHLDLQHLLQVQGQYEDHLNDEFHGTSFTEIDFLSQYRFKKTTGRTARNGNKTATLSSLDELDPETREIFLISDAYGAEGELGVIVSKKFMEHDAYCMFDSLMNGVDGVVAMADFFSPTPSVGSITGLPPILEASSALYNLLPTVDSSLHTHLVELGVESQYFALRWLRLLFGREFSLDDLLLIWDEIFSSPNHLCPPERASDSELICRILSSPRGAFISAMAVSMILSLRSSLLATEHATSCLQRLLNFPKDVSVKNLIEKAKSLQALALRSGLYLNPSLGETPKNRRLARRGHSLSFDSSTRNLSPLTDNYWEDKWKVLHAAENLRYGDRGNSISRKEIKGSLGERFALSKADSANLEIFIKNRGYSDKHNAQENIVVEDYGKFSHDISGISGTKESLSKEEETVKDYPAGLSDQNIMNKRLDSAEEISLNRENSFPTGIGSLRIANDNEYDSDKSSVTSSSLLGNNYDNFSHVEKSCNGSIDTKANSVLNISIGQEKHEIEKHSSDLTEQKSLPAKFQWLQKFGRGFGERNLERVTNVEPQSSPFSGNPVVLSSSTLDGQCSICGVNTKLEEEGKSLVDSLRIIGQSMLENIQVIESILKQDRDQENSVDNVTNTVLGDKGQGATLIALQELKKIGHLFSEM